MTITFSKILQPLHLCLNFRVEFSLRFFASLFFVIFKILKLAVLYN